MRCLVMWEDVPHFPLAGMQRCPAGTGPCCRCQPGPAAETWQRTFVELFDPASWCSPARVVIVILSPLSGAAALLSLSTAAWSLLAACCCGGAENQSPLILALLKI